ncbi:MAG: tol-pal system-associated acyl-CoA thioesterase [Candidatus Omnitrophota bacterium]|nr:MAG: tol-pal system-associated acyl-CoA thioesterase [Candidatus Omnitrophota bacterium]
MSVLTKKIYYHDTDCGGVVYYANYLKYFEEARTEYLREKGIDLKELSSKGILFVVRKVDIDYKAPARYADTLDISTEITRIKNVSLEFFQQVKRDGQILVSAKTVLVCINSEFQPHPMPQDIIENL